jgi:hypothetical protein
MKQRRLICILSLIACTWGSAMAEPSFQKVGDMVVDSKALNIGEKKYGKMKFSPKVNGASVQKDAMASC